ncbi:MAG: intradiol ring-cleavage dioxygenase, partial [Bacteroidetes bacterium]|nr:intradiol ring-cleavage dioxygenase [Bacteroidota bacterium]
VSDSSSSSSSGSSSTSSGSCTVTNSETDGPYPLYTSRGSALVRTDITESTQTGLPLSITLTILNTNNSCAALTGVVVDIWHCNKDGYYSGYANQSGYLGTKDYTGETWLRGRQTTDSNGQVKFTSIYPGWYTGRMTHIHVQIYSAANSSSEGSSNSILTTQIAFPDDITQAVYKTSLYSAHGENTITFSGDNVFSDGTTNEMATVTANSSTGGYDLALSIYAAG